MDACRSRWTPRIAHDTARTAAEARGLWWLVDRPNLFIKIPATLAGLPAITATLAAGISVNVTLIFSVERYKAVLDAFLSGPGTAGGGRRQPGRDRKRRLVLRQPGRHRGGQAARPDEVRRRGPAARPGRRRQQPAGLRSLRADARVGAMAGSGRERAPRRSACCGPPPGSRTRPTRTPNMSSNWSPATPSTPCLRRRCTRSPTMARFVATRSAALTPAAHALMAELQACRGGFGRRGGSAGTAGRRIV